MKLKDVYNRTRKHLKRTLEERSSLPSVDLQRKEAELHAILAYSDRQIKRSLQHHQVKYLRPEHRRCNLASHVLNSLANILSSGRNGGLAITFKIDEGVNTIKAFLAVEGLVGHQTVRGLTLLWAAMSAHLLSKPPIGKQKEKKQRFLRDFECIALQLNFERICRLINADIGKWNLLPEQDAETQSQWARLHQKVADIHKWTIEPFPNQSRNQQEVWSSLVALRSAFRVLCVKQTWRGSKLLDEWALRMKFDPIKQLGEIVTLVTDVGFLVSMFDTHRLQSIFAKRLVIECLVPPTPSNAFALPETQKEWMSVLRNSAKDHNRRCHRRNRREGVDAILRQSVGKLIKSPQSAARSIHPAAQVMQYFLEEGEGRQQQQELCTASVYIGLPNSCCFNCHVLRLAIEKETARKFDFLLPKSSNHCHPWRFPEFKDGPQRRSLLLSLCYSICDAFVDTYEAFADSPVA